jgi:SAM-dependent methyltransferase
MSGSLAGMRAAYNESATAWARGPSAAYEAMAQVLLAAAMTPLSGSRILDLGAGTGAAARVARAAGAGWVIGVDVAPAMLEVGSGWDAAVVADAMSLPFARTSFDLVVAACCLGHLPDPRAALVECRRLAPAVVASAFLTGWTHPAKAMVDETAIAFGFTVPEWYVRLKTDTEPKVDDPARLERLGRSAGYGRVEVSVHSVDVGLNSAAELAAWRLGMAHLAPFVANLGGDERTELTQRCVTALTDAPPLVVPLVVLSATN